VKKKFAVFDIDGALPRMSLFEQLVHVLVLYGKLDVGPAERIQNLLRGSRDLTDDETFKKHMDWSAELLFKNVQNGLSSQDYQKYIDIVVKKSIAQNYTYSTQLMQSFKRNNFFLIGLSTSEKRLVSTYAKALGFDAWLGQVEYIESSGKLTGEINTLSHPKEQILRIFIDKFELNPHGSTAVGDTASDIALLDMCENPIAFNPKQAMFRAAREKNWTVVLERKDMVYGLQKNGQKYVLETVNV